MNRYIFSAELNWIDDARIKTITIRHYINNLGIERDLSKLVTFDVLNWVNYKMNTKIEFDFIIDIIEEEMRPPHST